MRGRSKQVGPLDYMCAILKYFGKSLPVDFETTLSLSSGLLPPHSFSVVYAGVRYLLV